jgi:hypothetical protein
MARDPADDASMTRAVTAATHGLDEKLDALLALVKANANASLHAHDEHRRAFLEVRAELDDLRGRVERGTNTSPPLAEVARSAARQASDAKLEAAAVEGRTLAAVSELHARVEQLDAKTDAQTEILATLARVADRPLVKAVAFALGNAVLWYLASKGIHTQ